MWESPQCWGLRGFLKKKVEDAKMLPLKVYAK